MDCEAAGVECEAIDVEDVFAGAWVLDVGHKAVGEDEGLADAGVVDKGCNAIVGGCNTISEVCEANVMDRGAVNKACEVVDEDHKAVVFAGTQILVIGGKAVGEGDVLSGAWIISAGCKSIDEGRDVVEGHDVVDKGCDVVDKGIDKGREIDDEDCKTGDGRKAVGEDDVLAGAAMSPSVSFTRTEVSGLGCG